MKKYDYIILGQGIAGTLLSWHLIQAGKSVLVIDRPSDNSSSNVAAGVITPVAGMRYVPQNRKYLSTAYDTYRKLSEELDVPLINTLSILRFEEIPGIKIQKLAEFDHFSVKLEAPAQWEQYFLLESPLTNISPGWVIDLRTLLSEWRIKLKDKGYLLDEAFSWDHFSTDTKGVSYKGYTAGAIICCEGGGIIHNPYFKDEEFDLNKGQALILSTPELPRENIYLKNIKLIPWEKDLFWAGTSFELEFDHTDPTPDFRAFMDKELKRWLKLPYRVVDHMASVRVTTKAYQPIMKDHNFFPQVKLFNGLGSKGCANAPYFVREFVKKLLTENEPPMN